MELADFMSSLLAGYDMSNYNAEKHKQDRPWKVLEIKRDEYVVLHMPTGSKFRVKVETA